MSEDLRAAILDMYEHPEGVMRGWFDGEEDLAEHLANGGYRIVDDPSFWILGSRCE